MKNKVLYLALCLLIISLSSCSDDEKPKSPPEVTTAAATGITTTTATAHGEITSDGNATITESGFVYSSAIDEPTVADTKVTVEADDNDMLEKVLEGLNSGTTYHIRAYAINSKGTAYGDAVDFMTGNAAPTATNVVVTGQNKVGQQLTATYTYSDAENDAQATSTYKWYVADDAAGTGETAIAGATSATYVIAPEYEGKYLSFGVTPKAATGTITGVEVKSDRMGGVGEATTVTFVYNSVTVTYGILTSTTTQRKWLDRNLGAPNVPTAFDNFQNYGDLFQWGRLADGHQLITRNGNTDAQTIPVNGTTTTRSTSDNPGHSLFILTSSSPRNWRSPANPNFWQGVNGINNPCPAGWRIPTRTEWDAEQLETGFPDAYNKLKITLGGQRQAVDGTIIGVSPDIFPMGSYWTSQIDVGSVNPWYFEFFTGGRNFLRTSQMALGSSCRCIKE